MEIRKATYSDAETLHTILKQSARRIQQKKSKQWSQVLEGAEYNNLLAWIDKGFVYVGVEHDIMAMAYLYPDHLKTSWDDFLWEDYPSNQAFYLHKLALADGVTGQGKAHDFLVALQAEVFNNEEVKEIRLDCMAEKNVLNKLYQTSGFNYLARIPDVDTGSEVAPFNLYTSHKKK